MRALDTHERTKRALSLSHLCQQPLHSFATKPALVFLSRILALCRVATPNSKSIVSHALVAILPSLPTIATAITITITIATAATAATAAATSLNRTKMLLPSALSCEPAQRPVSRLAPSLFSSPPASPPTNAFSGINNIMNSCRALHSMLAPAPIITSSNDDDIPRRASQLPTPPLAHATIPSPMKLRLRTRRAETNPEVIGRKKIVKRTAPPRGANKRCRAAEDEMGRDDDIDSDLDIDATESSEEAQSSRPRTPKRARIAPEFVPLGLDRSDFHDLHRASPESAEHGKVGEEVEVEADGEQWSTEEDRILVELILEKLKLTKNDWQDCARSLGKDRSSVGRRWKSLMVNGDVGLKSRTRRGKLHGTWR
ncbi:hypothetical protein TruAng_002246 [Truncatella angustata]|nr:hypothetical protein TruAng_002246 [Truncatella angustata]